MFLKITKFMKYYTFVKKSTLYINIFNEIRIL